MPSAAGVSGGDGEGREGGAGDGGRGVGLWDGARVPAGEQGSCALLASGGSQPEWGGVSLSLGVLLFSKSDGFAVLARPLGGRGRDSLQESADVVAGDAVVAVDPVSWLAEPLVAVKRWTGTSLGSRARHCIKILLLYLPTVLTSGWAERRLAAPPSPGARWWPRSLGLWLIAPYLVRQLHASLSSGAAVGGAVLSPSLWEVAAVAGDSVVADTVDESVFGAEGGSWLELFPSDDISLQSVAGWASPPDSSLSVSSGALAGVPSREAGGGACFAEGIGGLCNPAGYFSPAHDFSLMAP